MTQLILECVSRNWTLEIGDPDLLGWGTVAAYLVASILSFRVFFRAQLLFRTENIKLQKLFWLALAVGLLALAVNKQMDLQSLFIVTGKCVSLADGWYLEKQLVRNVFTVALAVIVALGFLVLGWLLRSICRSNAVALAGVALILLFIVIRAATFMHFGGAGWSWIFGTRLHWILELSGILLIGLAAMRHLSKPRG